MPEFEFAFDLSTVLVGALRILVILVITLALLLIADGVLDEREKPEISRTAHFSLEPSRKGGEGNFAQ